MKAAVNAEEKKFREQQTADYKKAGWMRVYLNGRKARMMKRADYEALQRGN